MRKFRCIIAREIFRTFRSIGNLKNFRVLYVAKKWACIEGLSRVVRGGSWLNDPDICRVAYRNRSPPDNRDFTVGFRLVFVP